MGLDYVPKTPSATAFCDALGAVLAEKEHRKNQRRGDRKQIFNRAAGAVAADLLKAAVADPKRWSWRLLTTATFTGGLVSYTDFTRVLAAAEPGHLLEKRPGHYARYDFGDGGLAGAGRATRFRALPGLFSLAGDHGLTPETLEDHFERKLPPLPRKPLVLRASSIRSGQHKFKGRSIHFMRTAETDRMEQDIKDLNEFLFRCEIGGGTHRGYRRIFNQGDETSYCWNKGGRLYSVGDDSYQTLKKAQRLQMTLDGEPVAEIDIRASYLTLLHGLRGVPFDLTERDPYKIDHLPRAVVKAWVTMTIGHRKFHKRWPKRTTQDLRETGEEAIDTKKYPVKQVTPIILDRLPILRDWPKQSLSGFDLMYRESVAVIGTMLELMRKRRVPSLSVHDSIIVPARWANDAAEMLRRHYERVASIVPFLEIKSVLHPAQLF
jgi:hypothetical protein